MTISRPRLTEQLARSRLALVVGGIGLGKSMLLAEYAAQFLPNAAYLHICREDEELSLLAFLSNWTRGVMRKLADQDVTARVFEGANSAYAARHEVVSPVQYAHLIAQDLSRLPLSKPLTFLFDNVPMSTPVLTFLVELARVTVGTARFVLAGPEVLVSHFGLEDITLIGPGELTLRPQELYELGWSGGLEHQGIFALAKLAEYPQMLKEQFIAQVVETVCQARDGERLLGASLLDDWRYATSPEILKALDLPPDYLQQFQALSFPLPGAEDGCVQVPLDLRLGLRRRLRELNLPRFEQLVEQLALYYGATDPVRAYLLRGMVKDAGEVERQGLLRYARQHLEHWINTGEWQKIRESLSPGITTDSLTGRTRFYLTGNEALYLARAIYELASNRDELRLANKIIHMAREMLLPHQPYLGNVEGLVLMRMGQIEHARQSYEALLEAHFRESSPERANLLARILLCYLQMGEANRAWGLLRLETLDDRLLAADSRQMLFIVVRAAIAQSQGVQEFEPPTMQELADHEYFALDDFSDFLALTTLTETWADRGNIEQARSFLALYPVDSGRPWHRMEAAFSQALIRFRQHDFSGSLKLLEEALSESRGLSVYSSRPEMEYQDVSFLVRVYFRQFLAYIRLGDVVQADKIITRLQNLLTYDPSLQHRLRVARSVLSACLNQTVPSMRPADVGSSYTELRLVVQLMHQGYEAVAAEPYAQGMLKSWRNWNWQYPMRVSIAPELTTPDFYLPVPDVGVVSEDEEPALPRQLTLRCLGVSQPIVLLDEQKLKVNLRQFFVLAALAEAPRSREELKTLFFATSAQSYLGVMLSNLNKLCAERGTPPLHVFEDGKYRLAPDVLVDSDLKTVRSGKVAELLEAYRGPLLISEDWLDPFVTPDKLRQEILARLTKMRSEQQKVKPVVEALVRVDAKFAHFFQPH